MRSSIRRGVSRRDPRPSLAAALLPVTLLASLFLCSCGKSARAQDDATPPGTGALKVVGADGRPAAAFPLRHTRVDAEISGSIARVVVEQTFENPYSRSIEAVYVFPLPHEAAVDDLEMRIGERIVRGEIRTRQAAREIYERAREQGQLAALLDQERPNIFTQQVANIQPGHVIVVRIRYVESLEYRDGTYSMVFPTVVGPRYIPGQPLGAGSATPASTREPGPDVRDGGQPGLAPGGTGWSRDTDRVPDASRITPPVIPPGRRTGHDIQIAVDLDAGVPIQDLECPSHAVDIERPADNRARVRLRPADTIPNKDFVLRYRVAGDAPEFGFLAHRQSRERGTPGYFSLQLQPPMEVGARDARPKEMVFLLDCSGSMQGEPIARSKAAMRWAMQHLNPDDTFQIIRFSESASAFRRHPVRCTPQNVQDGLTYLETLQGGGGTEMLAGIEAALGFPADPERLRIVCMLTDGFIGNEVEILGAVRQMLGEARLFSFGIGSSVNRYLLDALAEEGRGVVDYVPLDGETRPLVERFYDRIAMPCLTDITIDWGTLDVDGVHPVRIPDLFAGRPLVLAGRYLQGGQGTIVVRGKLGRAPFERRLRIDLPVHEPRNAALGTLWARRRIDTLMQRMVLGEIPALVEEATDVALAHRLMTRYTSFVAVDNQVVSKDGEPMLVPQPVEMPAGVSYEGVFGLPAESVQGASPIQSGAPGALHVRGGRSLSKMVLIGSPPPMGASRTPAVARPVPVAADEERTETSAAWSGTLELQVEPERGRVLLGEPIRLRVRIRNIGVQSIEVPSYLTAADLALVVRRQGGGVPQTELGPPRPRPTTALAPGAERTYTLALEAADARFLASGRYEIVIAGLGGFTLREPFARCTLVVE